MAVYQGYQCYLVKTGPAQRLRDDIPLAASTGVTLDKSLPLLSTGRTPFPAKCRREAPPTLSHHQPYAVTAAPGQPLPAAARACPRGPPAGACGVARLFSARRMLVTCVQAGAWPWGRQRNIVALPHVVDPLGILVPRFSGRGWIAAPRGLPADIWQLPRTWTDTNRSIIKA